MPWFGSQELLGQFQKLSVTKWTWQSCPVPLQRGWWDGVPEWQGRLASDTGCGLIVATWLSCVHTR